jgi:hypothetical protein
MSAVDPNLTALALLYANGELDAPESAAFESRLGEDQSAREALCQAVQLTQGLGGARPPAPSPAYRDRVRRGLANPARPRRWWHALLRPRAYPGHPAAWLAAGALAASLLLLGGQFAQGPAPGPAAGAVPRPAAQAEPAPATEQAGEMARIWADLHTPEHLERVRADEQRRKHRQEERRLARGEERAPRGPTH